ncbi:3-hydroxyacyl-ACP dehydratase FabZ [Neisseria sp. CCUG17229]|uniref:3-hydroxyacyl-[acyl-carrier-protein] dehydratase FabZ n=1 Tax=Neisseria brasiliensis TaxID=2666100 RepID=A0A5Q3RY94_9NEIS|nr:MULTISPECIES: 3-hydroxyacyl-ACP dehydratase FabZ [Neisseria]MRN37957.1 3-hydroxyacyl-ACP dehydratase FabZ [Neisseria brasiliensis]PJO10813.1 3-hydroxyacyl-[acyl-carrier-protein] dehydratase FabZ [Neisseria sp. N95_16]PJO78947.1 3-hydroxyacyl-[acyl-carrier-protein] dehydratase FabZ [Neisseria sp. N177_16]QGL24901.1 3-hydroxyacyl-ACP dehydratase FabZ [Neisseria brasiliensis]
MDFTLPIEAKDIQKLIPHRYPFLQLDRITAYEPMKCLTAIKNVTMNEPQFQGHFPDLPVMPGVLIIEAMAQACGTLAILSEGGRKDNEFFFFAGIDNARFKRQVIPGDQLVFEVELITSKRGIGKFNAVAKVDGQVAVEAEIMCAKRVV